VLVYDPGVPSHRALLELLRHLRGRTSTSTRLDTIAARAGWSPFHLHRAFRAVVGETPKQFIQRLRLERAAARLLLNDDSVLSVAGDAGFNSHEVFTRAFRRHFGRTPIAYRAAALGHASTAVLNRHTGLVETSGPCIGLYHLTLDSPARRLQMPTLSIQRRDMTEQPFVFVRLKVARSEISKAIAEGLGKAFPYVMQAGLPIVGRPTVRYITSGPGLFDMQVGVPIAVPAPGAADVQAGALPGGAIAVGLHAGPYDQLGDTYAAMERWMEANGYRPSGSPWESYVTDPGDVPDTKDWRTEVYWPIETTSSE
jgi:AraC family transcriptional regulator